MRCSWPTTKNSAAKSPSSRSGEEHADHPDSRARFLLEAEITGGLEHPGIVPVYGLCAYPDGRPFYAMRFIHGESLREAIQGFHKAESPDRDPGERALALAACSTASWPCATRSPTRTAAACCTAT